MRDLSRRLIVVQLLTGLGASARSPVCYRALVNVLSPTPAHRVIVDLDSFAVSGNLQLRELEDGSSRHPRQGLEGAVGVKLHVICRPSIES